MKKILFLAISFLAISCSKDDEPVTPIVTQDLIVGNWTKTALKYELQNGTIENQTITGCDLQDKLNIAADGTFDEINFGLSVINNNCVVQTSGFTGSKIWAKANNGNYFLRKISTNPNYDSTILIIEKVTFFENKMTFRIRETNVDLSNPTQIIFYEETYQKN